MSQGTQRRPGSRITGSQFGSGHVEFESPAGHVRKTRKFRTGARERGGADKSSADPLVCRIAQVARTREREALRGSRVNSEEALEVGGKRGAT